MDTQDYEKYRFNSAIAKIREFTNVILEKENELKNNNLFFKKIIEAVIKLLSPITPHIAEEMWFLIGNKNYIIESTWPEENTKFLKKTEVIIAVQINGKLKGTINLPIDTSSSKIEKAALSLPSVIKKVGKKKTKKVIVVKNKIINIVL